MRLGPSAQRRLAVVLADMLGEPLATAASVSRFLAEYLRRAPTMAALGLRVVLWAIVWLPVLFVGRPLPADRLSERTRRRYLLRWASSKVYWIREGFYLAKAIALLGWGAQDDVRERFHLPPVRAVVTQA